ncbi:MAG: MarR family winged helix-turn-helix transcriptional regulator [Pseudomonadota bacterium]
MSDGGGDEPGPPPDDAATTAAMFKVFVEIGIIHQLAKTSFERVMPGGLQTSHFGVLNHLHGRGDGKSLTYLAFAFQVTKGTMTNTVQKLSQRGLIEVRPDPHDGRGKLVYITETGRLTLRDAVAALGPTIEALKRDVGPALFADLLPKLEELRVYLDEARNDEKPPEV